MILNSRRIGARVIANLIFFSFLLASTAIAQSPGTFIATGSMTARRFFHTATLLADGRVLIAGGQRLDIPPGDFTSLSSAEIYDPRTGTFTATGSMARARSGHTATLLPNGKVLIAGGSGDRSAELYDPNTGAFTLTANMIGARRRGHLAPNGKVLILGGTQTGRGALRSLHRILHYHRVQNLRQGGHGDLAPERQSFDNSGQPGGASA